MKDYNIFWGIIFIYFLGLFLCMMIPTEANAATEVNTTTNSDSEVKSRGRTVVISPPPSAISPSMGGSSSDLCMKVAAVSVLCQDRRVYDGMVMAGTPCPFLGEIGTAAAKKWKANPELIPEPTVLETKDEVKDKRNKITFGTMGLSMLLFLL